ncbi:MAG: methyltransferase domain-containing protein [Chloracidobacterium sp.]|nr:methyltransferase domain-containing protein [Chloracidobacterium sp.]MDW8218515.1 methyltransferase domain-containing protein [Acidobacteriota bacterium]
MEDATAVFWKSFVKHPRQTGAIVPSSRQLAQAMLARTDLSRARFVIELGPGTGAFTEAIVAALPPGADFLAIERNPELVAFLRRRLPHTTVICDNAVHLRRYTATRAVPPAAVFCGLPLSWLASDERNAILDAVADVLPPGGVFTLFQYIHAAWTPPGRRVYRELARRFQRIERRPTWWNLPPAYVMYCFR